MTKSKDLNLRRWASEGSRPRLPWGERLTSFVTDPNRTHEILESLKFDQELYVRKSVANHLNDIAKDHPEWVVKRLHKWMREASERDLKNIQWIARHALRTLVKNGLSSALDLLGIKKLEQVTIRNLKIEPKTAKIGENFSFEFELLSGHSKTQQVVVDYIVHFARAGERQNPKVFKLKTFVLAANSKMSLKKIHSLRPITTRKYHAGAHRLSIQVNGELLARVDFVVRA